MKHTGASLDHDEAVSLLQEGNIRQRLEAARYLEGDAQPSDRVLLTRATMTEPVPRIRAVLRRTLDRLPAAENAHGPPALGDEGDLALQDASAKAVQDTASRVVHEVRKLLPGLRLAAEREIESFAGSRTQEYIGRLDSLIEAIDRLGRAASAPMLTEFDLSELIEDAAIAETNGLAVTAELVGRSPLLVPGDRELVRLALTNGLRNAIEASLARGGDPEGIVISWDLADVEVWVTIHDRGIGLPTGQHRAFEAGRTTKSKHAGMGLAIAKQAMDSLGGAVTLAPREDGGATYEMSWPTRIGLNGE